MSDQIDSLADFQMATSVSNVAGGETITTLGSTFNQIANLLSGPVLWVVLAAATVMVMYGLADGSSRQGGGFDPNGPSHKWTITGFVIYIFVGVAKGMNAYLHGSSTLG